MTGLCSIADYFVLGTSTSNRHFRSLADALLHALKLQNIHVGSVEGMESGRWLLIDAFEVIVNIFNPEAREYYDLELLWGDAPRIEWPAITTPPIPERIPSDGLLPGAQVE